jgi:hypothetical protein
MKRLASIFEEFDIEAGVDAVLSRLDAVCGHGAPAGVAYHCSGSAGDDLAFCAALFQESRKRCAGLDRTQRAIFPSCPAPACLRRRANGARGSRLQENARIQPAGAA